MSKRTTKTRPGRLPDFPALADRAGAIKAQIAAATAALAPLQAELDTIRATFVAHGQTEADGAEYRATVSTYDRAPLDQAALLADYANKLLSEGVSERWIAGRKARHTGPAVTTHSLRVSALKARGVRSAA